MQVEKQCENLTCCKCKIKLVYGTVEFEYMDFTFQYDLPRCPSCGQIYVPEDLAAGKMLKVEMELEEK